MKNIPQRCFAAVLACFFYSANVMAACNIDRLMGLSYQSAHAILKFDQPYAGVPDRYIFVSGDKACRGYLSGAVVRIVFLSNQIVEIEVRKRSRKSQRKRVLAKWAESNYGVKSGKPVGYFSNEPNAQWHWETSSAVITYSIVTTELEIIEYVQIQSTVHEELFSRFGSQLDKQ